MNKKPDLKMAYVEDICKCTHKRKFHGKSCSINYTQGKCNKCACKHFDMSNSLQTMEGFTLNSSNIHEVFENARKLLGKNLYNPIETIQVKDVQKFADRLGIVPTKGKSVMFVGYKVVARKYMPDDFAIFLDDKENIVGWINL